MNYRWVCILLLNCLFIGCNAISKQQKQKDYAVKKVTIAVISDLNASYGDTVYPAEVQGALNKIIQSKPDIIICAGDMVAGQSRKLNDTILQAMWQAFYRNVLQPVYDNAIPFAFTLGNHDASPGFINDRKIAGQFWQLHKPQLNLQFVDSTHYPFYYSFIQQNIFFISWDASSAKLTPEIYPWLYRQLQTDAARKADSRILLGHLPFYPIVAAKNKPGEVLSNADSVLQLIKNWGIDLYVSGHQHAYFTGIKNQLPLLNSGCLGNGPRPILQHADTAFKTYSYIKIAENKHRKIAIETFNAVTHKKVETSILPDSVQGFNGTIYKW